MASPRIHFKLAKLNIGGQDTILALGGLSNIYLDTVEEWVEETSSWKEAESLSRKMRFYGLAIVPAELICPK